MEPTSEAAATLRAEIRRYAREDVEAARAAGTPCREVVADLGRRGLMGTLIPAAHGGTGEGLVASCIVAEELGAVWPSLGAMRAISAVFVAGPLLEHADDAQRDRWLAPMVRGEQCFALALTEPGTGSDARGIQTRARRQADGSYVVDGLKHWISCAAEADAILTYVLTDPDAPPDRQLSAFMIPADTPGVRIEDDTVPMGLKDLSHTRVHFDGVRVGDAELIGPEGGGLDVMMDGLEVERVDIASRALGCAVRALEEARDHAAVREQFGRAIRRFQAVSHKIAEMRVTVDAARLLTERAALLCDQGRPCTQEAAVAKLFAAERGHQVCDDALQVLGAAGYAENSVVSTMLRDVRALRFGGGTDEIMRHLIQREEFARHPVG